MIRSLRVIVGVGWVLVASAMVGSFLAVVVLMVLSAFLPATAPDTGGAVLAACTALVVVFAAYRWFRRTRV